MKRAAREFGSSVEITNGFSLYISDRHRSRVWRLKKMSLRKIVSGVCDACQLCCVFRQDTALKIQQAFASTQRRHAVAQSILPKRLPGY
jgi:hypothetical protein